jgi:hypothetical protein
MSMTLIEIDGKNYNYTVYKPYGKGGQRINIYEKGRKGMVSSALYSGDADKDRAAIITATRKNRPLPAQQPVEAPKKPEGKPVLVVAHIKVEYHSPRSSSKATFIEFTAEQVFESAEDWENKQNDFFREIHQKLVDGSIGGGMSSDHSSNLFSVDGEPLAGTSGASLSDIEAGIEAGYPAETTESPGSLKISGVTWRRTK